MNFFKRLFESAEAREQRIAEEAKKEAKRDRNSFWILVVLESGMQGNIGDNIAILEQRFPGAYEDFTSLLQIEFIRLAQSGLTPSERKARFAAFTKQFTAALGAKAKG